MYKSIVFSGGGLRGISFIGALDALVEKNIVNMSFIKNITGTSAGAIISFYLALNTDINEIKKIIIDTNFAKFIQPIDIARFFSRYGLYSGKSIVNHLKNHTEKKFNKRDMTFSELYKLTGKNLTVVGARINDATSIYFNKDNTPDIDIHDAVRISIGIPYIFTSVKYKNEKISNNNMIKPNDYYVDGGLFDNFPMSSDPFTIGLRLVTSDLQEYSYVNNIIEYSKCVIGSILKHMEDLNKIKNTNIKNIYDIDISSSYTMKFDISKKEKTKLLEEGYNQTVKMINIKNKKLLRMSI